MEKIKKIKEIVVRAELDDMPFNAKTYNELEDSNSRLQKFIRRLEKDFHEVIWYIGIDLFFYNIYERFMLSKGGFMEIRLGDSELKAFFNTKAKAEKFRQALIKSLKYFSNQNYSKKIQIKEEFININDLFKIKRKDDK